jgi:hypothetical protein
MDDWNGGDIVSTIDPWLLASSRLCHAVTAAGLTGLQIGMFVDTFYSPHAALLASLGELAEKEIPEFRIVLARSRVQVAPVKARSDGSWQFDDDLRYGDWNGDDFTRCERGTVLSPRAFDLVQTHRVQGCTFWTVRPG